MRCGGDRPQPRFTEVSTKAQNVCGSPDHSEWQNCALSAAIPCSARQAACFPSVALFRGKQWSQVLKRRLCLFAVVFAFPLSRSRVLLLWRRGEGALEGLIEMGSYQKGTGVPALLVESYSVVSRPFATPWPIQSVMSDSLRRHRLYSPGNRPGQNTGVGSLSLLQGIFPTQGSNPGLPHCGRILYLLSHQGSPRILAWVASPFSSGPRSGTGVSCTASLVDSSPSHTHSPRRLRVRGRGLQCRLAA